ncbi:NucA/NucB deoxyribonuclease domain-containing protein [Streptomyces milbemycinicus]|uniref:NucA/NucB deoxyribonuclease domain-containing protein n=1 Tax=Streptomyces milbemycinicus TaxID=476552 RepID=A0ABW8M3U8_9ACTN
MMLVTALLLVFGASAPQALAQVAPASGEGGGTWIAEPFLQSLDGDVTEDARGLSTRDSKVASQSGGDVQRAAMRQAKAGGSHSYRDTSKVPLRGGKVTLQAAGFTPPRYWADTPPAKAAKACLAKDSSNTAQGETHDRWLWCQKYRMGLRYYYKTSDGRKEYRGSTSIAYNLVTVGSGQVRGVRTYFQARKGSLSFDDWSTENLPSASLLPLLVQAQCADEGKSCNGVHQPIQHTWRYWNNDTKWKHWDFYSHESASSAKDKVLFHKWHLSWWGKEGTFTSEAGHTMDRTVRCDSANYFTFFGDWPQACVNYDVVPHLQYSISDQRVASVARHIRTAQDSPEKTYPIEYDRKVIPGKFTNSRDDRGLHRLVYRGKGWQSNENVKNAACQRKAPYEGWRGHPAYNTTTHQCDEYPFASTWEGAADPDWAFSVRAVPKTENEKAGGLLTWYFFADRILYDNDEFWVQIKD